LRYLVRVGRSEDRDAASSIHSAKERLAAHPIPRHENFRASGTFIEFDLYEASSEGLREDLRLIEHALGPILSVRNLSRQEPPRSADESVSLAKEMYSEERFWEVHEELESQWRKLQRGDPEKEVLQGLILLVAAYVHTQKGEEDVALSILGRTIGKLEAFGGGSYRGIDVRRLREELKGMKDSGRMWVVELPPAV